MNLAAMVSFCFPENPSSGAGLSSYKLQLLAKLLKNVVTYI